GRARLQEDRALPVTVVRQRRRRRRSWSGIVVQDLARYRHGTHVLPDLATHLLLRCLYLCTSTTFFR
ncbi:unnamed protein product, partial [Ectocarpus sp. 12 AP-2014]